MFNEYRMSPIMGSQLQLAADEIIALRTKIAQLEKDLEWSDYVINCHRDEISELISDKAHLMKYNFGGETSPMDEEWFGDIPF